MRSPKLSAIVSQCEHGLEAQLLEIDIAVRADTMEGLLSELAYVITVEYRIAKERGKTPFGRIEEAPQEYWDMWKLLEASGDISQTSTLNLSDDVREALAIALHTSVPVLTISHVVKRAA